MSVFVRICVLLVFLVDIIGCSIFLLRGHSFVTLPVVPVLISSASMVLCVLLDWLRGGGK